MTTTTLDISDFGLGAEENTKRMRILAEVIAAEWKDLAKERLKSTASAYIASIHIRRVTRRTCTVSLPGTGSGKKASQLARIVEFGMGPGGIGTQGPYDVRKTVLKAGTSKLRYNKKGGGMYVNIPFGHTPGSVASQGGTPLADKVSSTAFTHSVTSVRRHTSWGSRLSKKDTAHIPKLRSKDKIIKWDGKEYTQHAHATNPLQGLVKFGTTFSKHKRTKKPVKQSGSEYMTWRRMSFGGKPWISKGVQARRLGEEIAAKVPKLVGEVF